MIPPATPSPKWSRLQPPAAQVDHAAQLPLPAFCMPGDTFPLSKLVPFKKHPCEVVESAGVVILEEVAAEPPPSA